jgi:hypothetical protein
VAAEGLVAVAVAVALPAVAAEVGAVKVGQETATVRPVFRPVTPPALQRFPRRRRQQRRWRPPTKRPSETRGEKGRLGPIGS